MSGAGGDRAQQDRVATVISLILPPPRHEFLGMNLLRFMFAYFVGMLCLDFIISVRAGAPFLVSQAIPRASGGLVGMVILFGFIAMLHRWRFRRRESELRSEEARLRGFNDQRLALARMVFDAESAISMFARNGRDRRLWTLLQRKMESGCLPRPRSLVDERRTVPIAQIELPDVLLEPETIASGAGGPAGCVVACIVILGIGSLAVAIVTSSVLVLVLLLTVIAFALTALPLVRRRLPWVTEGSRLPIAGVGFVRDRNGRTWTTDDAMMLVSVQGVVSGVTVELVGANGVLRFAFADETDPEFIKLWQRWNHPHPRPELLE
jgi:hypothetical protein